MANYGGILYRLEFIKENGLESDVIFIEERKYLEKRDIEINSR